MFPDVLTRRFSGLTPLTAVENAAIAAICQRPSAFRPREEIRAEGVSAPLMYFLLDGWAQTSIGVEDGARQILKAHVAGDLMGAPSAPFAEAVETITAVTACVVAPVAPAALAAMFESHPRLAWLFFLTAQEERVALMDRLTAGGQLGAHRNLALLLLQLHARLNPLGDRDMEIPMTQQQMGDMLGLSPVHVNRVLQDLQRDGLVRREGRRYALTDPDRLRAFVGLPLRTFAKPLPGTAGA